jgi:hypothetical protein
MVTESEQIAELLKRINGIQKKLDGTVMAYGCMLTVLSFGLAQVVAYLMRQA